MPLAAVTGDEGRGEPVELLMRRRRCVSIALAAVLAAACASGGGEQPTRPVVLVSGLDDHQLAETDEVPLHSRPGGPVSGTIPAGTLARAAEVRGEWVKVTALELHAHQGDDASAEHTHDYAEGWVGDYYLRSRVHVISPDDPACPVDAYDEPGGEPGEPLPASAQVEFVTVRYDRARMWVLVRTVVEPAREVWVPRAALSEYSSLQLTRGLGHAHGDAEAPPLVASSGEC